MHFPSSLSTLLSIAVFVPSIVAASDPTTPASSPSTATPAPTSIQVLGSSRNDYSYGFETFTQSDGAVILSATASASRRVIEIPNCSVTDVRAVCQIGFSTRGDGAIVQSATNTIFPSTSTMNATPTPTNNQAGKNVGMNAGRAAVLIGLAGVVVGL